MTANSKRIVIWAAVAGIIVIALVISFMPRAVMVDLVEVEPGRLVVTLDEEGAVAIMNPRTRRFGLVPTRAIIASAIRLCSPHFCIVTAMKKPPIKRKII